RGEAGSGPSDPAALAAAGPLKDQQLAYAARIALDRTAVDVGGRPVSLAPGDRLPALAAAALQGRGLPRALINPFLWQPSSGCRGQHHQCNKDQDQDNAAVNPQIPNSTRVRASLSALAPWSPTVHFSILAPTNQTSHSVTIWTAKPVN